MKSIFKVALTTGLLFTVFTSVQAHHHMPAALKNSLADSTDNLFAPGTKPQLISKQFSFTEGASVDKKGNVFFTDQPNDKIWEYDVNGKLSVFLDKAGRANGMYFDKKGNLIACADENNQLWSISPKKEIKVLLKDFQGHLFNGPNDVWIAPDGGLYITDPYFQRDYWTRKKSDLDGEKVYYLPKGSSTPVIVAADLKKPNGIVGTPDGKYLYVADGGAGKTFKYKINKDGSLTDKTLFVSKGSDGMTLDELGNLYITGKGVTVFNPQGKRIAQIVINEPWTANICFGGKNKDVLFLTASTAIYTFQMKVKGVE
ncbi:MAG: gnl [Mucilaginibacter sp.]|nr:gnl [Mucilaginibacter sp.]